MALDIEDVRRRVNVDEPNYPALAAALGRTYGWPQRRGSATSRPPLKTSSAAFSPTPIPESGKSRCAPPRPSLPTRSALTSSGWRAPIPRKASGARRRMSCRASGDRQAARHPGSRSQNVAPNPLRSPAAVREYAPSTRLGFAHRGKPLPHQLSRSRGTGSSMRGALYALRSRSRDRVAGGPRRS